MSYNSESWRSQHGSVMSDSRADNYSSGTYSYQSRGDHYYEDYSHDAPYLMSPSADRSTAWSTSSQADTPRADTFGSPAGSSAYMDYQQNEVYSNQGADGLVCQCGKTFRRTSDLTWVKHSIPIYPLTNSLDRKHQKYHIKNFPCLIAGCDRVFSTYKDLTRHYRSTHKMGEGWKCHVKGCRKAASGHVYSRKDNYDRHVRTAHPANWASQNGLVWSCDMILLVTAFTVSV